MKAAETSVRRLDESLDEADLDRTAGKAFIAFQSLHLLDLRREVLSGIQEGDYVQKGAQ